MGPEKEPVAIPRQVSVCLLSGHTEWACDIGSNPTASVSMPLEWACDIGSNPTASVSVPLEWAH